jgi:response regulator RpfG family c-di-GMP phosphodiesterase
MKKQSILCVDDEKFVLNSLKEQLKSKFGSKYSIELAESGEDALEIFNELQDENIEIPLVISDYIMPGMKGDELLKTIHKQHPNTITILLTGQATITGVVNAINQANLYRYINKPWETEDLSLAVLEALKSYNKDRQIEEQNKRLQLQNQELLLWTESFVKTMSKVIDTRDTTTAGHSLRIANYAVKTAIAMNNADYGKYKDSKLSENEIKELYYSALLHDIGKIGIREQILLKDHRISLDRQNLIVYKMNWYIEILKAKAKNSKLEDSENQLLENLPFYINTIISVNNKEILTNNDISLLNEISQRTYIDIDGIEKPLINSFELENLSIIRGTLTNLERDAITSHAEYTYNILKEIPWPKNLQKVPEISSGHHERLNGTGYFKGLVDSQISISSRILAILDVYEALTSEDRTYKHEKTSEEAIAIIKREISEGKFDKDIFEIFVKEKIYEE